MFDVSVGIDIVSIPMIRNSILASDTFIKRWFHPDEWTLGIESIAARHAAKEALLKATKGELIVEPSKVSVRNAQDGSPYFYFSNDISHLASHLKIALSMSHTVDYACAIVIVNYMDAGNQG